VSTERLLISSNWRWYLLQSIMYCSHNALFAALVMGAPGCSPVNTPLNPPLAVASYYKMFSRKKFSISGSTRFLYEMECLLYQNTTVKVRNVVIVYTSNADQHCSFEIFFTAPDMDRGGVNLPANGNAQHYRRVSAKALHGLAEVWLSIPQCPLRLCKILFNGVSRNTRE